MDDTAPERGVFWSYRMLDLQDIGYDILHIFELNDVRFHVRILAQDLEGDDQLFSKFTRLRDGLQEWDIWPECEDWVLDTLKDELRILAPKPPHGARKSITLQEYFDPPTHAFKLVNRDSKLVPVQEIYDPQHHGITNPRTHIVDAMPEPQPRRFHLFEEDQGYILRSSLPSVPLIPASQLERFDDGLKDFELSNPVKKVRRVRASEALFFKAGFRDNGYIREIDMLSKIQASGKFLPPFRTSKLVGLVVWDDDKAPSLMGMLLEYIKGENLYSHLRSGSTTKEANEKWFSQIKTTVKQLHGAGLVWGDAKPDNIMINEAGDAIVVDFGGGYTPEYVPRELMDTVEGDLMALKGMAAELGVEYETVS
ncbi:hypothetical protein F4777DRAFT_491045 [Nemania sp. FL0916]|nr:hypothetical protein F4777DRAFT_491045 [Nemania sp. FL0916]